MHQVMKVKIVLLLALTAVQSVIAPLSADPAKTEGELVIPQLPREAFVYINGIRAVPEKNKLRLPAGNHLLQVEMLGDDQVLASLLDVSIDAGKTNSVPLNLRLVYSGFAGHPGSMGPVGPPGPPGPAGSPGRAMPYSPEEAEQTIIREIRHEIEDLEGRIGRIRNKLPANRQPAYYCAGECEVVMGPPGLPGPMGPPGHPPIPADVYSIRDHKDLPLLDQTAALLDLPRVQKEIAALEQRIETLPPRLAMSPSAAIQILTPDLQAVLKGQKQRGEEIKRALDRGEMLLGDSVGPPGKPGPRGPRGAVGSPDRGVESVRLSEEKTKQLLERLGIDSQLKEKLVEIQREILLLWPLLQ